MSDDASASSISKPSSASFTAGAARSFHGSLPKRAWANARPATVPGTPTDFGLKLSSFFVNIVLVAASGAVSR